VSAVSNVLIGFLAAVAAGLLYAGAIVLQALESRDAPAEHRLQVSLLTYLLRRPRWLLGTGLGIVGWPLQAVALALAPVALVQPTMACGLLAILVVGRRALNEHITPGAMLAAVGIVAGIGLLAFGLPGSAATNPHDVLLAIALVLIALLAVVPLVYRQVADGRPMVLAFAAGAAYVWIALATTLLDLALSDGEPLIALAWLAGIGAITAGGAVTEMSAFGVAPATRVAPVVFACEMVVPALLAPLLGQSLALDSHDAFFAITGLLLVAAGVAELSRTRAVANIAAAGH
jgi:hypothetical protein